MWSTALEDEPDSHRDGGATDASVLVNPRTAMSVTGVVSANGKLAWGTSVYVFPEVEGPCKG